MSKKLKKLKTAQLQRNALIRELARLFINNPVDLPSSPLREDDYYALIKAAEIMTNNNDFAINKDSRDWSYFTTKWNALYNYNSETQLEEFRTCHDIFSAILGDWDNLKQSPYSYRCIASLIRMLVEELG